jgi:hypothetical protein
VTRRGSASIPPCELILRHCGPRYGGPVFLPTNRLARLRPIYNHCYKITYLLMQHVPALWRVRVVSAHCLVVPPALKPTPTSGALWERKSFGLPTNASIPRRDATYAPLDTTSKCGVTRSRLWSHISRITR